MPDSAVKVDTAVETAPPPPPPPPLDLALNLNLDLALELKLIPNPLSQPALLAALTRTERASFPPPERLPFPHTLAPQRHNTSLHCTFDRATSTLLAYLVLTRTRRTVLLHKLCVLPAHRGRGVGTWTVRAAVAGLRARGAAGRVQLWVDEGRGAARRVYARCGFVEVERVEAYYGPGRTGVRMVVEL
ncbi:hypothetical protein FGG08_007416 [Glutinoglossum americanum]|uniref:N-acetyltransferase domain-containing protein n=1 Tax=Glutinoglossum americanum TaxID=1670608 RepID=A0A9P8HU99_9PEZI|nr:hypothetical protein FGG08_007416 [Glutinoglossum americanum]